MKNLLLISCFVLMAFGCKEKAEKTTDQVAEEVAEATDMEASTDEWVTLFDGSSMDEWQAYMGGEVPAHWKIEGGAMVFNPPTAEERKGADGKNRTFNLVTKREFTSFFLSMEWKISDTGNSGVFWGVVEDEKFKEPYHSAMEIQVLDNDKHPDGKNGTSHQAGALYDLVSPAEDVTKPVGEWNLMEITIDHENNLGIVVLNDSEIVNFPVNGEKLDALLKGSKFDGWEGFAKSKTGKIGLQDHGDVVSYRNIKIKAL